MGSRVLNCAVPAVVVSVPLVTTPVNAPPPVGRRMRRLTAPPALPDLIRQRVTTPSEGAVSPPGAVFAAGSGATCANVHACAVQPFVGVPAAVRLLPIVTAPKLDAGARSAPATPMPS